MSDANASAYMYNNSPFWGGKGEVKSDMAVRHVHPGVPISIDDTLADSA